jgi:membrane fusion protein
MSGRLFRDEVIQARRRQWLGEVVLGQPPSLRLLAGCALVAAMLVASLLAFGEYTQRTRVAGQLVPSQGLGMLTAPVAGILAQVPVEEGQRVLAGDTLAVMEMPRGIRGEADAGQAAQASIAQRRQAAFDGFESQRRRLARDEQAISGQQDFSAREIERLLAELDTRVQQQALAEQLLARHRRLRAGQYITELQLQQQAAQALEARAAVQSLERQVQVARRQLAQLAQVEAAIPEQLVQLAAAHSRELAGLDQESADARARTEQVLRAPVTGLVGTLLVHAGQPVNAGQPLLTLLPAGSGLEAHLAVPSRAIGFLRPGHRVQLRYAAYPYQKFGHQGGRVLRISSSALAPAGADGEPQYRVVIGLDSQSVRAYGREEPLRPGAVLEADLLGQRRRLWEWVLEPLYTLGGRGGGAHAEEAH